MNVFVFNDIYKNDIGKYSKIIDDNLLQDWEKISSGKVQFKRFFLNLYTHIPILHIQLYCCNVQREISESLFSLPPLSTKTDINANVEGN